MGRQLTTERRNLTLKRTLGQENRTIQGKRIKGQEMREKEGMKQQLRGASEETESKGILTGCHWHFKRELDQCSCDSTVHSNWVEKRAPGLSG